MTDDLVHATALGEFVDGLLSAGQNDPVVIYTDPGWYASTQSADADAYREWWAAFRRARDAGSRCSRERPCETRDPAHLLMWGECFHRSES